MMVFVIVMFTAFLSLAQGESVNILSFVNIPLSILTGIICGALLGKGFAIFILRKIICEIL